MEKTNGSLDRSLLAGIAPYCSVLHWNAAALMSVGRLMSSSSDLGLQNFAAHSGDEDHLDERNVVLSDALVSKPIEMLVNELIEILITVLLKMTVNVLIICSLMKSSK